MARISEAIGYDVEVSEPNGPAVHGYITSRWADSLQPEFDRWLAEHDRNRVVNGLRRKGIKVAQVQVGDF